MTKIASILMTILTCFLLSKSTSDVKNEIIARPETGVRIGSIIINSDEPIEVNNPDVPPTEPEETEPIAEEVKTCPEGKFLNPKTNRCKNLQEISESSTGKTITTYNPETGEATTVKICNDGYFLNTETNRCNKQKTESSTVSESSIKTCPEGKFLNPKTNRCKNLQEIDESTTGKTITTYNPKTGEATIEKICNDGYELDEDSNRCKKIKKNDGEKYNIEVPNLGEDSKNDFMAIGSIILILSLGLVFVIFQYRHEIMKFIKSLFPNKKS